MSHPVPATLYRIAAAAGIGSALVLLVNAAKRAEVIPTSAVTQLVAPLAQIMALAFVTALYFAFGRRTGTFGLVAYLLNAFALAALVGVEFVINLVFSELPASTIETLRAGPLGVALTVASIAFLLGTLAFVMSMFRTRELPTVPLVLYASAPCRSRSAPSCPKRCWTSAWSSSPWASPGSRSGSSTAPPASPEMHASQSPRLPAD